MPNPSNNASQPLLPAGPNEDKGCKESCLTICRMIGVTTGIIVGGGAFLGSIFLNLGFLNYGNYDLYYQPHSASNSSAAHTQACLCVGSHSGSLGFKSIDQYSKIEFSCNERAVNYTGTLWNDVETSVEQVPEGYRYVIKVLTDLGFHSYGGCRAFDLSFDSSALPQISDFEIHFPSLNTFFPKSNTKLIANPSDPDIRSICGFRDPAQAKNSNSTTSIVDKLKRTSPLSPVATAKSDAKTAVTTDSVVEQALVSPAPPINLFTAEKVSAPSRRIPLPRDIMLAKYADVLNDKTFLIPKPK